MFRSLTSQLAQAGGANQADAKKSIAPSLRGDIYNTIDQARSWLAGGAGSLGQAGDGVAYKTILATVQKHFPDTKLGLELVGSAENEAAVIVGGVTNMILEMSKWEGMAGGMAARTWADGLVEAHARIGDAKRKDQIARGIAKGVNQNTDVTLLTQEFAAKIQIISCLKTVSTRIFGSGSPEARQGEALWSAKLL
ncbi:hypothetical protein HGRIS_001764 [Hohenbuehelia grisea]|uniref:Uncharacterized protein n=1 Tax=Hohenbuehelia grisea TaxID=104357 RepID=A0ABR3JK53_9AGAR